MRIYNHLCSAGNFTQMKAMMSTTQGYTQGHSDHTLATHLQRTAETDAAFLVPLIKATDHILDVGCGPGTITTSLARYAHGGQTIGIDMAPEVVAKAQQLATVAGMPISGPGSVAFENGNILQGLRFADGSFDIVYASQVMGHMVNAGERLRALQEMRRLLKRGGILATRDGMESHFYPSDMNLDCLWSQRANQAIHRNVSSDMSSLGTVMPMSFRQAGFTETNIGAGTKVFSTKEARQFLVWRSSGQLLEDGPFRQSWLDAGISKEEIDQSLVAVRKWAETKDAWFCAVQCEMLAWK